MVGGKEAKDVYIYIYRRSEPVITFVADFKLSDTIGRYPVNLTRLTT